MVRYLALNHNSAVASQADISRVHRDVQDAVQVRHSVGVNLELRLRFRSHGYRTPLFRNFAPVPCCPFLAACLPCPLVADLGLPLAYALIFE